MILGCMYISKMCRFEWQKWKGSCIAPKITISPTNLGEFGSVFAATLSCFQSPCCSAFDHKQVPVEPLQILTTYWMLSPAIPCKYCNMLHIDSH